MSDAKHITVEMIEGGAVLIRFPLAYATQRVGNLMKRLEGGDGEILLSVESLAEAETLRDALSACITFHRGLPQ